MKKYKTYFDKSDTPFKQEMQQKKKYHTVWFRQPYMVFLQHAVVKIKLWGLFTIYSPSEEELAKVKIKIDEMKQKEKEQ